MRHGAIGYDGIEGWLRAALVLICALAIAVPLVSLAGCGKRNEGEAAKTQEDALAMTGETAEQTEQQSATKGGNGAMEGEEADEAELPAFSFDEQSMENYPYPTFDLVDVRWSDHGDYFRVVFELQASGGGEVTLPPLCHVDYPFGTDTPEAMKALDIHIIGAFANRDTDLTHDGDYVLTDDEVVEKITLIGRGPTDTIHFRLDRSWPYKFRLFYLPHPMRIVVDVSKRSSDALRSLSEEAREGVTPHVPDKPLPIPWP